MFTPYGLPAAALGLLGPAASETTVPGVAAATAPTPLASSTAAQQLSQQWNLGLQLYLLMQQKQLQLLQQPLLLPVKQIKEEEKDAKHSPAQTSTTTAAAASPTAFSIDQLLHDSTTPSVEESRSIAMDGESAVEAKEEKPTVYTLDSLDCNDGRSRESDRKSAARCICDECGKSYATASNLSRHKQTHRPIDSEHAKKCPHCERVYVSMPALSMHMLTHNAQHECGTCGKTFSRLWLLQGHLRSHTGTRPFGCAHCGKFFSDRSNLRAHILTHTSVKKFECRVCGKRFVLRSYLNRHLESCCTCCSRRTTSD